MTQTENLELAFEIDLDCSKEKPQLDSFGKIFLGAVDFAFSTLGDQAKQVFYCYLERSYGISRKMIPENVEAFAAVVEAVFGQSAWLIEIRIMGTLHEKFPISNILQKKANYLLWDTLRSYAFFCSSLHSFFRFECCF
jgi:hypothetical protein